MGRKPIVDNKKRKTRITFLVSSDELDSYIDNYNRWHDRNKYGTFSDYVRTLLMNDTQTPKIVSKHNIWDDEEPETKDIVNQYGIFTPQEVPFIKPDVWLKSELDQIFAALSFRKHNHN